MTLLAWLVGFWCGGAITFVTPAFIALKMGMPGVTPALLLRLVCMWPIMMLRGLPHAETGMAAGIAAGTNAVADERLPRARLAMRDLLDKLDMYADKTNEAGEAYSAAIDALDRLDKSL